MKIYIDADACPKNVLEICKRACEKKNVQLITISSFDHNIMSENHIVVDNTSQATDLKIMNLVHSGDMVITQDWGLAAMVISKKAICLNLNGKEYRDDNIDLMLEEREIKAKYRRNGGRTKGPQKRTRDDDIAFEKIFIEKIDMGMKI